MIEWWWAWVCILAGGVCGSIPGYLVSTGVHARRQLRDAQRREQERQRVIHDTRRISVARPGSRPGRVSKASIDMSASHMRQHDREVD